MHIDTWFYWIRYGVFSLTSLARILISKDLTKFSKLFGQFPKRFPKIFVFVAALVHKILFLPFQKRVACLIPFMCSLRSSAFQSVEKGETNGEAAKTSR